MSNRSIYLPIILFLVLYYSTSVFSQPKLRELTLEQCLEIAQTSSPDALNSKQEFRKVFWDYRSFKAQYLPSLNLSARPLPEYYNNYRYNIYTLEYKKEKSITNSLDLSLDQMIGFTGGTLSLNTSLLRVDNLLVSDSTKLQYYSDPVNIQYTQPLFKYNRFKWEKKIKPLEYEEAKKRYLEDIEDINIKTTDYFFNLLQAQIDKKIALANRANYDTLFRIARGRYELGKIAENELLMLELSLLRAQASVETAVLQLDNAQFYFKSFLRIKDTIPVNLRPPAEIHFFTVSPVKAIEEADNNSSASVSFAKQRLQAASEVNRAKRDGRFDADIYVNLGLSGVALMDLPEAYKNLSNKQIISFGFQMPILDWGVARGKIKMAESQQEIVLTNVEQSIIDYDRSIYLQVMQFNMQKNQIRIAAKADTVAKKTFEVTKGRYLIGKVTSILELNNAQTETDSSEKSYYSELQRYWKSYFALRKLTLFDFASNRPLMFNLEDVRP